ncbi:MAG TPA: hypothetical protein VGJ20_44730 [Xanthobacteraceae bacterium]
MSVTSAHLPRANALRVFPPHQSDKVPTGPDWLREVKYEGYRMMLIPEQGRVRLISRGRYDWTL